MNDTIEKRAAPRHKVLKGGTIAFDGNDLACTVRNLSATGAAFDLATMASLPPSFMLKIECGQSHDIWTSNMICACRKRS